MRRKSVSRAHLFYCQKYLSVTVEKGFLAVPDLQACDFSSEVIRSSWRRSN